MGSRYEIEVTIGSARDLKNVNWRHGDLNPYVVAWVDPSNKCSTKVDLDHDANPVWDEKLTLPLPPGLPLEDAVLYLDVVHANAADDTKPLVGSARLPLREVLDEAGIGGKLDRSLKLKRPSGRPHGKIEVRVAIREPARYYQDPYAPPYGQAASRDYREPYGYPQPYAAPPPPSSGYPYGAPPPSGYPYAAPPAPAYGYGNYGAASTEGYGYGAAPPAQEKKSSKFGMGTGLAVGAAAGLLGGLAIAEGVDYVEDKIADEAAEKVEDDLGYDDGDYGGDDF